MNWVRPTVEVGFLGRGSHLPISQCDKYIKVGSPISPIWRRKLVEISNFPFSNEKNKVGGSSSPIYVSNILNI